MAVESIGPFPWVRAYGPLITAHDLVISAGLGIGHHPHRFNERLFYLERGTFDHDDALSGISSHVPKGALARFTEGRRGMVHREWNHGKVDTEIHILVTSTNPIPAETTFEVLTRERIAYQTEAAGITTREMVGPRSPLPVFSDFPPFADSTLQPGSGLERVIGQGEGGLLSVREGKVGLGSRSQGSRFTALLPPGPSRRVPLAIRTGARAIPAVFGPGHGLVAAD